MSRIARLLKGLNKVKKVFQWKKPKVENPKKVIK